MDRHIRSNRGPGMRLVAATLLALLVLAACGSDDEDDATSGGDEAPADAAALGPEDPAEGPPVKIGLVSDGKHAAVDLGFEVGVGEATVEYVNRHRGGLAGRPIELVTCLTGATPAKGIDCGNQMVEQDVAAVVVGSSAVVESIWQPLHDAEIPVVFYGAPSAKVVLDRESSFVVTSPTAGLVEVPIAAAKEADEEKVTVVVIDLPAAVSVYDSIGKGLFEDAGLELDVVKVPPGTADMTPQLQPLAGGDPGVVHVVGNDTFCISAFNGLHAGGFDGTVTTIAQCFSDAVKQAVPTEFLEGMRVAATAPLGTDDESVLLYRAVQETYAAEVTEHEIGGISLFTTMMALQVALEGTEGELTPASITAAIKAMPEKELPGSGGQRFRCNGKAIAFAPAACVRSTLVTTLDADGEPTTYETVGASPIED
jgi:branched-chain amino acid transport system substrate-binding protein